jgi:hypothetical protein
LQKKLQLTNNSIVKLSTQASHIDNEGRKGFGSTNFAIIAYFGSTNLHKSGVETQQMIFKDLVHYICKGCTCLYLHVKIFGYAS